MNDSTLVAIRTYMNHFVADVAKTALDAAGIQSVIRSDDCGGTQPALWYGGVELVVDSQDAAEATAVLDTTAQPAAEGDSAHDN
jgi:hypothetical protein